MKRVVCTSTSTGFLYYSGLWRPPGTGQVLGDPLGIGRLAAQHFHERGFRDMAIVSVAPESYDEAASFECSDPVLNDVRELCNVSAEHFCTRKRLQKRLTALLCSGQNVAIIGPRRVGKSSLIHEVAREIRNATLVYVDLWGVRTMSDLVRCGVQAFYAVEDSRRPLQRERNELISAMRGKVAEREAQPARFSLVYDRIEQQPA